MLATAIFCMATSVAVAQLSPVKATEKKMEAMDQAMMEHGKMEQEHAMSPWKELDAYRMLTMRTAAKALPGESPP